MFPIQVFTIQLFTRHEYALCGKGGEEISFAHARDIDGLAKVLVTHLRRMHPRLAVQCIHDPGVLPCLMDFDHIPDLEHMSETGFHEKPLSALDRRAFIQAVHYELHHGGILS